MGNPDLCIVINDDEAIIVKGTEYSTRFEALEKAIARFNNSNNEIERMRRERPDLADPGWNVPEVKTIRIYEV